MAVRTDQQGQASTAAGHGGDTAPAVGLFLAFAALYLKTLCPTVYLGDSGEFTTAVYSGGVPHPPGYPLFGLLGRLFLAVIPFGEPAFRLGCVEALAGAGAVVTAFLLAREIGAHRWAALTGAGVFGAGYALWSQSVRVEVYSLHALLAGLVLLFALRYRSGGSAAHLIGAAAAGSLGVAHHPTIVLLAPPALALCGPRLWSDAGRGRRLGVMALVLAVGPALYGLLMLWARAEPLQNWGRPVDLAALWTHASARIYQGSLRIPAGPELGARLAEAGHFLLDNFPYALFLLLPAGAWRLWRRDRTVASALIAGAAVVFLYNLCYTIPDITGYYLPVWLIGAVLLAYAVDAGMRRLPARPTSQAVGLAVVALLIGAPLFRNLPACDLSHATWVRELARQKLENTDPDGVLIGQGDHDTFPLWYVQDVLGVRPDVAVLDRGMIGGMWSDYDKEPSLWYLHRLRKKGVSASLDVPPDHAARGALGGDGYLKALLRSQFAGRPLCMTFGATTWLPKADSGVFLAEARRDYHMLPQGIVLRLQPKSQPVDLRMLIARNRRLWENISLPNLRGVRTDQDLDPQYVTDHYACMLTNFGGLYELAGDAEKALSIYQVAADYAPGYGPATAALNKLRQANSGRRGATAAPRAGGQG